jgi:hypothetical protein
MKRLTATLCLTIAVLLGSAGVSVSAAFQKGLDAAQSGDFATALREWTPLAEEGNAVAQSSLGNMYRKGKGVPQGHKTAVKWYRLAAEQGECLCPRKSRCDVWLRYGSAKGLCLCPYVGKYCCH